MLTTTPSSAVLHIPSNESIETLGLSGTTLMCLWSIEVESISDLTAHDATTLRQQLKLSQSTSSNVEERIEKVLSDIQTAMKAHRLSLKVPTEAAAVIKFAPRVASEKKPHDPNEPPDHESLDRTNEEVPRLYRDPMQPFYQDMKRYKRLLSREEQNELGRQVQANKDVAARDILVLHNLRLVVFIARKYLWSKLELADLVQEGIIGLIIAAEKYNPTQAAFTTYAFWWIRQAISRAIQDQGDIIRIPVHMQELVYSIRRATNEIALREGRPPTLVEIATAVNKTPREVKSALKVSRMQVDSLDDSRSTMEHGDRFDEDSGLYESIADETALRADHVLEAREELDAACGRLNQLTEVLYEDATIPERNKEVFVRLYGLDGSLKGRTLDHVSEKYDITRERVREIIQTVWGKIQLSGLDMDHESVEEELWRIGELEKLAQRRVSVD